MHTTSRCLSCIAHCSAKRGKAAEAASKESISDKETNQPGQFSWCLLFGLSVLEFGRGFVQTQVLILLDKYADTQALRKLSISVPLRSLRKQSSGDLAGERLASRYQCLCRSGMQQQQTSVNMIARQVELLPPFRRSKIHQQGKSIVQEGNNIILSRQLLQACMFSQCCWVLAACRCCTWHAELSWPLLADQQS